MIELDRNRFYHMDTLHKGNNGNLNLWYFHESKNKKKYTCNDKYNKYFYYRIIILRIRIKILLGCKYFI